MKYSIVLPTYNARDLTISSMARLDNYLGEITSDYEIILVDDGSRKEERASVSLLPKSVKYIQLELNKGKGYAVKRGMLEATGECRIFTDIDLPFDLSAIPYSCELILNRGFHFVGGDRSLLESKYHVELPIVRLLASKVFSRMVTLFIIGGIFDSQCGFKAFSGRLADLLFSLITVEGFAFDVEIYYLLLKYNITIKRIPVFMDNHNHSTVSIIKHCPNMIYSIAQIPIKWKMGYYHCPELMGFDEERYWIK